MFGIISLILLQLYSAYTINQYPSYQYLHEEDVSASDTSHIPIRTYHHVSRYFPQNYDGGFGGYHPQLIGGGYHHGGYFGGGLGFLQHGGYGGGSSSQSGYDSGRKHFNDGSYKKGYGNSLQDLYEDRLEYNRGKVGFVNSQGDSGLYFDQVGGKKRIEDGRFYNGGKYINQGGENSDEKKQNSIRRKGHIVKGFKKSHHSDENSNKEEYYDEKHDEGDNLTYKSEKGVFKDHGQSSVKGLADTNYYNNGEKQNKGQYNQEEFLSKNKKEQDQYGHNNHLSKGNVYGLNSDFDAQSLLGHQESENYHKNYHHAPFFLH